MEWFAFQEQLLKDENMYDCKQCGVLQEAIRRVQLRSLPPVLNFQLLRFIFERLHIISTFFRMICDCDLHILLLRDEFSNQL